MAQALPYIYQALAASAATVVTDKLASKDTPAPTKPKVAPTPDDKTTMIGKQRDAQRKYGAMGRTGTMLENNTLG